MEMTLHWKENLSFDGSNPSGQSIYIGDDHDEQGNRTAFSPIQLVAVALGGCTGMDVISIMQKKRQAVQDFEIKVSYESQEEHPHIWTSANIEYIVTGKDIDPKAVERSIELSIEKYCPVNAMLSKAVPITTSYNVIESE